MKPIKDEICKQIDELACEPLSEQKRTPLQIKIETLDEAQFYGFEQAKLASSELVCELFETRQPDPKCGSIEQSELDVLKQRCETSEGDIHLPFVLKVITRLEYLEDAQPDLQDRDIPQELWELFVDVNDVKDANIVSSVRDCIIDLQAKLEQAEAEIKKFENKVKFNEQQFRDDTATIKDLTAKNVSLKEALFKYGQHYGWCDTQKIGQTTYICNCGLEKARKGGG